MDLVVRAPQLPRGTREPTVVQWQYEWTQDYTRGYQAATQGRIDVIGEDLEFLQGYVEGFLDVKYKTTAE